MERALAIPKSTDYFSTLTSHRLLLNAYFSLPITSCLLLTILLSPLSSLLSPLASDHSQCDVMPTYLVVT